MAKPRIIIAEIDINYLMPIQLKFVEEFYEKIELEIITDKDYFEKLFETPQRAEILIISEDLYSSTLQRHNISKIFLLSENNDEEGTSDLKVHKIFKYSNIRGIFNEIIGKSASEINVDNIRKMEPQIIVVTSAAGGVGNTTVSMGLAACLSQNYKRILYINCGSLQSFGHLLKNPSAILNNEIYSKLSRNNKGAYDEIRHMIRQEFFSYIPPFKASLVSLGIPIKIFTCIAQEAKKSGEYDFIIMDTDAYFDDNKAEQLTLADKVIVVTRQTRASVFSTNTFVKNVNGITSEKYLFICNDFNSDISNGLISPDVEVKFSINEYINHIEDYDNLLGVDFAKQVSIKKVSYLLD